VVWNRESECKLGAQFHLALDVGEVNALLLQPEQSLLAAGPAQVVSDIAEASPLRFRISRVMSVPLLVIRLRLWVAWGRRALNYTSWNTSSGSTLLIF